MRKIVLILLTAGMMLLATGCPDPQLDPQNPEELTTEIITAEVEASDTKAAIDDGGDFTWSLDDQIAVHTTDGAYFNSTNISRSSNHKKADFTLSYTGTRNFFAVYPASAARENGSTLRVNLPNTYDITTSSNHPYQYNTSDGVRGDGSYAPLPMIATDNGSGGLSFKQVSGLLRITVNNVPPSADKLCVEFFDSDSQKLKVTGNFDISSPSPGESVISMTTGSNNKVTFTIGSASFWRDKVVLNIPVPAGTVYKMKVSALNSGNDTLLTLPRTINWESRRKSSSGKMAGKKVTIAFPAFEVNGSGYENYVRVKVAPANLVCEAPSIGQWGTASLLSYHFLEDQWSVSESPAKTLGTNYSNQRFVSLFGWATSGPYWGDDTNFYRKPNSTSVNIDKIYGPNCGFYELSDYGMYNCDWGYIYSGRPSGFAGYMAGWRTPSETEMVNLISNCNHSGLGCIKDREAKGGCYMYGLIILPKGCDVDHMPYHEDDKYSYHNKLAPGVTTFLCNVFTQDQWKVWEEEYGAVFLPCSGCRNNETVSHVTAGNSSTRADSNDYWGLYWTSTYWTDLSSLRYARFYAFKLGVAGIVPGGDITIFDTRIGMTVRLIKNVN